MLQMLLPIQLPTSWDAVFIEFSLAHFLWLSYQPTRASSFLKYSANLKEESRFCEKIRFFPKHSNTLPKLLITGVCETWILWNLRYFVKTKNWKLIFISIRLPSPVVAKWRIVSSFDMTSIFYGEKLEILKLPFTNFFSIRLKAFQFPSGVSWGIYFQERREECQKWEILGMSPLFLIILSRLSCWFNIINKV